MKRQRPRLDHAHALSSITCSLLALTLPISSCRTTSTSAATISTRSNKRPNSTSDMDHPLPTPEQALMMSRKQKKKEVPLLKDAIHRSILQADVSSTENRVRGNAFARNGVGDGTVKAKASKIADDDGDDSGDEAEVFVPLVALQRPKTEGSVQVGEVRPAHSNGQILAADNAVVVSSPSLNANHLVQLDASADASPTPVTKQKERPPTLEDLIAEGRWITEHDSRRRLNVIAAPVSGIKWGPTINTPRPSGG
ncbi:hypothetical protein P153DRAFT_148381 [Dothidotthia symphoricarpi CBS 119687]|uniref:Uncharacterized protein n=1 Tax=Dothidotthia symphoricarpi CBS 119687 TaxID=1392245 RepID=A0A6A5ZXV7_9PLEO|nr:uncharacterized protein P153DRAFT_148381 [Dothidotthia symphoricarpi CBS 119687]KAF2123607.1 hypothetical protein P153DRAFT_148381 [Dothidotthia symphoricarpi CBS 119687]